MTDFMQCQRKKIALIARRLAVEAEMRAFDGVAMIDHMGGVDFARGTAQPLVAMLLDLLSRGTWWIGLSNADVRSRTGAPWDDAVPFGRLFYEAAPDRCVWGTDWPHPDSTPRPDRKPTDLAPAQNVDDGRLLDLLAQWVPDRATRDRILVDNPKRLYDF